MKPAPEFARTATVSVLLVEDDPDFAALVRRCVAGLGGRSGLTTVVTLQEALQALRYGAFDLILLDLGLPDSSGLATLEGIAAATERPIIVLTANEDAGIREDSLSAGAYEFLHKKRFDASVLGRLVRLAAMQARTFGSLRESEARFRSLVALSSDYYWEQDASHRVTYVSAEYEAAAGGPGEAILGKRRWDYDISNMTEHAWQEHRAALESRRPFRDLELMRLDQNGEERWVAISGEPVFDEAGDFRGYRGIGRDISARKRAEEGLLRFRAALDESADMIVVIDRATMKYVDVNSTVCKLLGFGRAEMLTMGPQDLLPESREALERAYDAMIADPQAENTTRTHYRCKDGSLLPLESRRRALKSGKRWLIVSVGRDIRARVAAERALEESEARFRSLTQLSSDWYWEQDAEFRLTFMSSRMGERTGLDASAYLGRKRWDQPALNLSEADWQRHRGQLERHEPFRDFEMERRLDDGATVWLSLSGEPVYDAAGRFKGYRGVGRDITTQKRLDQLQRLEHNVTRCLSDAESASAGVSAVLRAICETLGWACGRYFEADERAGLLRFAAGWGRADEAVERYLAKSRELTYRRGQGLSGHVWQSAEPLWVRDVNDDPRASGSSRQASGRALQGGSFVFPVISRGATLGVMSFSSGDPKPPHERLLQAIAVIGSQVGQFLQRKQAEVALRDSILVLEKTFAHMDQGIAIFDARLRLVAVNRRARELLAVPEAVLRPGCAFEDIIRFNAERGDYGPVDVESFVHARVAVAARGEAHVVQREQANGTILEIRGTPMPDGGLIVVFTDVTASARGLQALRESEERFRETFELAGSGMAHVSLDGRFLRVNRSLCRMLGHDEGELIGRSVKDVSHPSDRDVTDAERVRIHDGEVQSQRFEKRYVRKDGSVAWIDLTVALARDARGRPAYEIAVMEDITAQKETQDALRRFRTALDRSADMFFLVDMKDGRLLDFNDTACAELGYLRDELIGKTSDVISDAQLADLGTHTAEATYRRKDGSTFPVEARRTVLETAEGEFLVVNSRDLTGRKREEERKSAHLRYQQRIAAFAQSALACRDPQELVDDAVQQVLVALGADAVAYVERGRHAGELVARALGGAPADAQLATVAPGSPVFQVLESGERFSAERAVLSFGWARGASATAIVPVPGDSSVRGALCVVWRSRSFGPEELNFLDAAAAVLTTGLKRVTSEERLAFLAQFDSLTGLPNRALLADRFTQMIEQTRRRGLILGVLFVDLDDFKMVNDTLGHAAGDELLKEAARRLEATVRPGDTVARISGDEFALVLADLAHQEDAALVAQKIIERLAAPFDLSGQEMFVTASVGIASFPADGDNAEALLGAADAAMYRAKQSGRNAFQFFTAEINQRTRARALLGAELRRALEREEFALFYQPKYDLLTRRPCGAEALLRWNHPERGVIAPTEFVHVLEETGLIVPVGEWVLRRACQDVKAWAAAGVRPRPVAVNLSARQFRQSDLDARIRALIAQAAVSPDLIELEITESQLMHDPEHAIRVMRSLRDEGIRIAIDDFGTGYSSLAYLTRLPVAALKIDRSFVAGIQGDNGDAAIVRTIIEMARTLRFIVVAEGVENEAQVEFLRQFGCHQAQGYLFARPMPAEDFRALISSDTDAASGKARPASLYQ